jgi:hypothetical protein
VDINQAACHVLDRLVQITDASVIALVTRLTIVTTENLRALLGVTVIAMQLGKLSVEVHTILVCCGFLVAVPRHMLAKASDTRPVRVLLLPLSIQILLGIHPRLVLVLLPADCCVTLLRELRDVVFNPLDLVLQLVVRLDGSVDELLEQRRIVNQGVTPAEQLFEFLREPVALDATAEVRIAVQPVVDEGILVGGWEQAE